ncbi:MAG: hypothetical protein RLZZ563_2064, partial [Pseudomonadota bacterium]
TSVNLNGDVVVANRSGGVTMIYATPDRCPNPANTSTGPADVKAWPDGCVGWYTPFAYASQRPVQWTQGTFDNSTCRYEDTKAWTSGANGSIDVVLMGLYRQTGLLGRIGRAERAQAQDCLARVGMADFAERQIGALSGGQQQRVFLARALAQGADLYLLDEPFAGVDAATEAAITTVLHALRDEGRSIVAVHHDLATVTRYFDRVLLLNRRAIAEGPVASTFRRALVAETYGSQLLTAIPA